MAIFIFRFYCVCFLFGRFMWRSRVMVVLLLVVQMERRKEGRKGL